MEIDVDLLVKRLAHDTAFDEMINRMDSQFILEEDDMYSDIDNKVYTDDAQEVYNRWYDYFYDKIIEHKI